MLGIFPLERWSKLTVRADKDNVSQQLRATDKKAEPMKKVSEGDAGKKHVSLGGLLTACHLGPRGEIYQPKSNLGFPQTGPQALDVGFQQGSPLDFRKLWPSLCLQLSYLPRMETQSTLEREQ